MWGKLFRREPSAFTVSLQPSGEHLTVRSDESILQAALREGLAFPHNCRVGGCGECKCRLLSGQVKEMTDKSYLLSAEELQQGYILACQSRPRADVSVQVSLRAAAATHAPRDTTGCIEALTPLTHDIMHLRVSLTQPMPYTAGQVAQLSLPMAQAARAGMAPGVQRSYSFASAPVAEQAGTAPTVDFFIRHVPGGVFTDWLFKQARVGDALQLSGPHGQFSLSAGAGPMVCVAGGSGLAPIKAMLEQAVAQGQSQRPLTVVLAVRTQSDLYGLDAIDAVRRQWSGRFRFEPVLSAEPEGSDWTGLRGMVGDRLVSLLGERVAEHTAWLCGPPLMVDACQAALCAAGVPATQVHADRFLDASHQAQAQAA